MIELMRNAAPKRKGKKPIITKSILREIERNKPTKRNGRMSYYKAVCDDLGVTVAAYYIAKRRADGKL